MMNAMGERVDLRTGMEGEVVVDDMTREDLLALIDKEARENFNMSGDEFARRWEAGDFAGVDDPRLTDLAILLP